MASRHAIEVSNRQMQWRVNRPRLVAMAASTLTAERVAQARISVALVDDATIHEINRRFLNHDCPTDVISFLLESRPVRRAPRSRRRASPERRGAGKALEGEIIISVETAAREAAGFGWPTAREVSLYLVHGLLHLCGYDDLTPAERLVMRRREIDVLAPWKIVPPYAD
jgi:probable rRNA maturation factor